MTYPDNDPNRLPEPRIAPYDRGWGIGTIMLGCLAFAAVVLSIFYVMSGPDQNMASNERPAVTTNTNVPPASRETTGSRAPNSPLPNNPSGTTPQRDTNQPAPAPANR